MIEELILNKIFTKTKIGDNYLFHLDTPITFSIGKEIIKDLKKEYLKDKEIGGYINFGVETNAEDFYLEAKEVIFIENQSKTPLDSYVIGTPEHKEAEKQSLKKGFLPLRFHTHPTIGNDPIDETANYLEQLNTSLADKYQSFKNIYQLNGRKLILPDILVVENSFSMGGMFIGFYNGLVAPSDFEDEKNKSNEELAKKAVNVATEAWSYSSDKAKIASGIAMIGAVALLYKTRKHSVWILLVLFLLIAQVPITVREKNRFFGMTKGGELEIEIPEISEEEIKNNINSFKDIAAQRKKDK